VTSSGGFLVLAQLIIRWQIHRVGESAVHAGRVSSTVTAHLSRSSDTVLHPARIHVRRRRLRNQQAGSPQGRRRGTQVSRRLPERWPNRRLRNRKVQFVDSDIATQFSFFVF